MTACTHGATDVQVGNVIMACEKGHQHVFSDEQAVRLNHTPCCWCHKPIERFKWWDGQRFVTAALREGAQR